MNSDKLLLGITYTIDPAFVVEVRAHLGMITLIHPNETIWNFAVSWSFSSTDYREKVDKLSYIYL